MADVRIEHMRTRDGGMRTALALVVLVLVAVLAWFVFASGGSTERNGAVDVDVNAPAAEVPPTPAAPGRDG